MAEKLFVVYLNGAPDPMDPAYMQSVRASKVEEAEGRLVFTHSDGTIAAFFDIVHGAWLERSRPIRFAELVVRIRNAGEKRFLGPTVHEPQKRNQPRGRGCCLACRLIIL